jgi:hypothetical protein
MPDESILAIKVFGIGRVSPLQGLRNRFIVFRYRDQVNMVCHQSIRPDLHEEFKTSISQRPNVDEVVTVFVKDCVLSNAAMPNMMRELRNNVTKWSDHHFVGGSAKGDSTLPAGHAPATEK